MSMEMTITLVSAESLPKLGTSGPMRVYARVWIKGQNQTVVDTPVDAEGDTNPIWNFPITYTISESWVHDLQKELEINLYRQRSLRSHKNLGHVVIPLKSLFDNQVRVQKKAVWKWAWAWVWKMVYFLFWLVCFCLCGFGVGFKISVPAKPSSAPLNNASAYEVTPEGKLNILCNFGEMDPTPEVEREASENSWSDRMKTSILDVAMEVWNMAAILVQKADDGGDNGNDDDCDVGGEEY